MINKKLLIIIFTTLLMVSCSGNQTEVEPTQPPEPTQTIEPSQTPEPTEDTPDLTDFDVAQEIAQESIDALESSGIGSSSEGYQLLRKALDEDGPTQAWCEAVLKGVSALDYARLGKQRDLLKAAADAQGC